VQGSLQGRRGKAVPAAVQKVLQRGLVAVGVAAAGAIAGCTYTTVILQDSHVAVSVTADAAVEAP